MDPATLDLDGLVGVLAGRLRAARPRAGGTRVVAVDGRSGAGKSTVAAALAAGLGAPVVRLDDLYPGWGGLTEGPPRAARWVLAPLAAGRSARHPVRDWAADRDGPWRDVPGAPFLVLEGVGSGARVCAPYLSLLVWVHAPVAVRYRRGMARDGDAYRPYWDRWAAQEEEHLAAEGTPARADVVVDAAVAGSWRVRPGPVAP